MLTLADLARQASYLTLARLGSGSLTGLASLHVGGLRAGWAELTPASCGYTTTRSSRG